VIDHPYALAASLARPVVRGYMTPHEARCAIAVHVSKAEREGRMDYDPGDVISFSRWLLASQIKRLEERRSLAAARIVWRVRPFIGTNRARNVILAEAHDVNGAEGFPFSEPEVTGIVDRELYYARRPRHG